MCGFVAQVLGCDPLRAEREVAVDDLGVGQADGVHGQPLPPRYLAQPLSCSTTANALPRRGPERALSQPHSNSVPSRAGRIPPARWSPPDEAARADLRAD